MTQFVFDDLPERGKEPNSGSNLTKWIAKVEVEAGADGGRLGWIVASSLVIAALQRALHADDQPAFLLKGGTLIELQLGLEARSTSDVDTAFRGEFDEMLDAVDRALAQDWGPIEFSRSEVEIIDAPRLVKPRRFTVSLSIRGKVWRTLAVEVAASEGGATEKIDWVGSPSLAPFGLDSPARVAALVMEYQVAQKLHACSDPHDPPDSTNDRPRDLVDLILIRNTFFPEGTDLIELREACVDIFAVRARELAELQKPVRNWPPTIASYPHWGPDYTRAAEDCDFPLALEEAIAEVNEWISVIDSNGQV